MDLYVAGRCNIFYFYIRKINRGLNVIYKEQIISEKQLKTSYSKSNFNSIRHIVCTFQSKRYIDFVLEQIIVRNFY